MDLAWESHGTGRPLIGLHGFGMDRTVMAAALEPALAGRPDWRRIYPDLPGHGESPAGPGDSDGVAASVREWADCLPGGAPAVLAGWSYGGYLATALARRRYGRDTGALNIGVLTWGGIWHLRPVNDYLETNRANWDERAPAHAASPGYHVADFLADPEYLSEVVTFDLPRLGDIAGLRGVHLQCHIGTDTVSLTRLGASMTGFDFSAPALAEARKLAEKTGADATFVEGELSQAAAILGTGAYDLVFTGIGALCWLPSIKVWAKVVADLLKPGGRLFIREGHPMLWTLQDSRDDDLLVVKDTYFERPEPTTWDEGGTYVPTDVEFTTTVSHDWNHGLGEIFTALLDNGMTITAFEEHDSAPWLALPGQMTDIGGGEWQLTQAPWRVPHTYTLQAVKR
jgi:pimeloyl-ACP methyl ester carboxylesterase